MRQLSQAAVGVAVDGVGGNASGTNNASFPGVSASSGGVGAASSTYCVVGLGGAAALAGSCSRSRRASSAAWDAVASPAPLLRRRGEPGGWPAGTRENCEQTTSCSIVEAAATVFATKLGSSTAATRVQLCPGYNCMRSGTIWSSLDDVDTPHWYQWRHTC